MKSIGKFIFSVLFCEGVGLLATPFTLAAIPTWYVSLNKPFFSPPNWVFGPVWTLLYFLMGIAFYLIWIQGKKKNLKAIYFFLIQLFLNFLWSILFFGLKSPFLGFLDILILEVSIFLTIKNFYSLSKIASYLLIPYILWVTFATILNFSILVLN